MTEAKTKAKAKAEEQKRELTALRLVARGRANIDFSTEMSVVSTCANVLKVENDVRFFDETLAHVCARITKYVDSLELFDNDDLIVKVECQKVKREKAKASEKSTTLVYLDKMKEQRVFVVSHLDNETQKLETNEIETDVREWGYRRDERRNEFMSQLKDAINKVDETLVSISQSSTVSQEELDLQAEIKQLNAQAKAKREALKTAKKTRQEANS